MDWRETDETDYLYYVISINIYSIYCKFYDWFFKKSSLYLFL